MRRLAITVCVACGSPSGSTHPDAASASPDAASADAVVITAPPSCGNHIVEGLEGCDDGNTSSGDGYSGAGLCASASVWVVAPDRSSAPFIDGSVGVAGLGWDEKTNELVFLL